MLRYLLLRPILAMFCLATTAFAQDTRPESHCLSLAEAPGIDGLHKPLSLTPSHKTTCASATSTTLLS